MLSSSSAGGPLACISRTQPSQMLYRRLKCASLSLAAGSQGMSPSTNARKGSLKVLH